MNSQIGGWDNRAAGGFGMEIGCQIRGPADTF